MKRYVFDYHTVVGFNQPVTGHSLLLRCQPVVGSYMDVEEEHVVLPPGFAMCRGTDAFGNRILFGGNREQHHALVYVCTGIVSMRPYAVPDDHMPLAVFLQPTPLTALPPEMPETILPGNDATAICQYVHDTLQYAPMSTDIDTPVAHVLASRKGVCQDFAHLMVALCRARGIAARYVCGFMEGEGETHAWVEVFNGYAWEGYDPTHNRKIEYGYVKIAHGRDAADCSVSRGRYSGKALQQTVVNVMLKEV